MAKKKKQFLRPNRPPNPSVASLDVSNKSKCYCIPKDLIEKFQNFNDKSDREKREAQNVFIQQFVKQHVHDVYERIAVHFSHTRYRPWPGIVNFLNDLRDGSLVLDIGCGNGKYAFCNRKIIWIGVDRSKNLLHPLVIHKSLHGTSRDFHECPELHVADCLRLNVRSDVADACLCIAVLHHLPTEVQRLQVIRELIRCTQTGGFILIYVWSTKQEFGSTGARQFDSQDVPWKLQEHFDPLRQESSTEMCEDTSQPRSTTLYRYYHLFTFEEVEQLFSSIDSTKVLNIEFDSNNWKILLQKKR